MPHVLKSGINPAVHSFSYLNRPFVPTHSFEADYFGQPQPHASRHASPRGFRPRSCRPRLSQNHPHYTSLHPPILVRSLAEPIGSSSIMLPTAKIYSKFRLIRSKASPPYASSRKGQQIREVAFPSTGLLPARSELPRTPKKTVSLLATVFEPRSESGNESSRLGVSYKLVSQRATNAILFETRLSRSISSDMDRLPGTGGDARSGGRHHG
jgi:hypothetical protein